MRIVHATDCYLPRLGGIELHVRDLAQHQRDLGHRVTVATRTKPAGGDRLGEPHVLRLRYLDKATLERLDPDVVHVHLSVISPFALATARRAAQLSIPTVVTVHSLWNDVTRIAPLVRSAIGAHRWPVTWTAVSGQAAAYVERVVRQDVGVIPNAVDVEFWRAGRSCPERLPETLPGSLPFAGDGPPTILSVMRLTAVKRTIPLAWVLHHVAAQTDAQAVIVGDGPQRVALEHYLRRHHLTERVQVVGALDRAQVRAAMANAAFFVAPARRESFGIAALEARAAGLPVVAQAASGVASFIHHRREGLLADGDRALARYSIELARDASLRSEIAYHNRTVPPCLTWSAALRTNQDAYALAGVRATSPSWSAARRPARPLGALR